MALSPRIIEFHRFGDDGKNRKQIFSHRYFFVWEREQAGGKAQGLPECFLGFPRLQCR